VLTLSTIALDSRTDLPKVHYATALDWFIICCFGYCIATLLQFAGVHYFTKVFTLCTYSVYDEVMHDWLFLKFKGWKLLVILGHSGSLWVILGHVKVNVWILVMPKLWYLNVAQDWYILFLRAESNFNSVLVSKTSNNIRLHFRTKDFVDLASPLSIHYLPLMVQFLSFYVYKIS
jgi:hypothetical protein